MVKMSIIIPTLNRSGLLQKTLEGVFDQSFRDYEIVVIDGGSTDGTLQYLKMIRKDELKVLNQEGRGAANARNYGVQESKGEIIAFIDDDAIPDVDWAQETVRTLASYPKAGGVGGPISLVNKTGPSEIIYSKIAGAAFTGLEEETRVSEEIRVVNRLPGCNMIFSRRILDEIAYKNGNRKMYFDELYGRYSLYEDVDLCNRVRKVRYDLLYNGKIKVRHLPPKEHLTGKTTSFVRAYSECTNAHYFNLKFAPLRSLPLLEFQTVLHIYRFIKYLRIKSLAVYNIQMALAGILTLPLGILKYITHSKN